MERAWRRLQYKPPPTRSNQVARDLAFRAQGNSDFPGTEAAIPATLAPALAAAVSSATVAMPSTYRWPLHPAAIEPAYYRDQLSEPTTSRSLLQVPTAWPFSSTVSGKRTLVDAVPVSIYDRALQVATTAGGKEPLLDVTIGSSTFKALLDTGSSVSLLGRPAIAAAQATGASQKREVRTLRLATGHIGAVEVSD
ncbi:hypothetical protein HPB47_020033 [Ixodes persulcatus]|uniref:Uncharacterized protein n=1 Tax=Ixodes persulcatus TaxID=34615 RepID=A0AC60QHH1_IXOPE|nr:hypothetical protein HPB47_020033 [Ixodes persulcatus]